MLVEGVNLFDNDWARISTDYFNNTRTGQSLQKRWRRIKTRIIEELNYSHPSTPAPQVPLRLTQVPVVCPSQPSRIQPAAHQHQQCSHPPPPPSTQVPTAYQYYPPPTSNLLPITSSFNELEVSVDVPYSFYLHLKVVFRLLTHPFRQT